MTNINAPFGFRPSRHRTSIGQSLGRYSIASGYAANMAIGDVVKSDGAGGIIKAAAGDAILGTFHGWNLDKTNQGSTQAMIPFSKQWVSGTVVANGRIIALVDDDPFETFEVMVSAATFVAADLGSFANLVDAAPDALFGLSRQSLGAIGTGTQFRIERMVEKATAIMNAANNDVQGYGLTGFGQYAIVEVIPVKHERGGSAMAVAV